MLVKIDACGGCEHIITRFLLTCLNQHRAAMAERTKAVMRLRIATTSIKVSSEYKKKC